MRLTLAAFVLVALVHLARCQVSSDSVIIKPGQPEKCFDTQQRKYYDHKAVWYPNKCDRRTCTISREGRTVRASIYKENCDLPQGPGHCPLVANGKQRFPGCCPKHQCSGGVGR